MKEPAAIIAPAIDVAKIGAEVRKAHIALRDAEAKEQRDSEKAERSREEAAKARLELGRKLIQARKAWPARGPKAKGWGDFLRDQGIDERRAREWMEYAGYVEEISAASPNVAENLPTLAEAGIDKRPRKSEPREPDELAEDDGPTWTEEQRAQLSREIAESHLPPKREVQERSKHDVITWASEARAILCRFEERGRHLTDVTTSPEDFMQAKQLLIDIVNRALEELDRAGVLDKKESRRQLQLLDGGKK